jgi:hypothetical protein
MPNLSSQTNQRVTMESSISSVPSLPPAKQESQKHHTLSNRKGEMHSVQSPRKTSRRAGRRPSTSSFTSLSSAREISHGVNSRSSVTTSSHVGTPAPNKPTPLYSPTPYTGYSPTSTVDFLFEVHLRREKCNKSPEKSCPDLQKPSRKELILLVEGLKMPTDDW